MQLELVGGAVGVGDLGGQLRFDLRDLCGVVGRHLVDVVEPVAPEEVRVGAPGEEGLALGVVVGEVIFRQLDGQAGFEVAPVFAGQGVATVLEVALDVDLEEVTCGHQCGAGGEAAGEDLERRVGLDGVGVARGVARVGHVVHLVEAVG